MSEMTITTAVEIHTKVGKNFDEHFLHLAGRLDILPPKARCFECLQVEGGVVPHVGWVA